MPLTFRSCSAALLCAFGATLFAAPQTDAPDRQVRLAGVRSEISRLETELAALRGRESGLLGELERLGAELRLRRVELEDVTLRSQQVESEVAGLAAKLEQLNRDQDERRGYLVFRLREIYKAGSNQSLLKPFLYTALCPDILAGTSQPLRIQVCIKKLCNFQLFSG